MTKTNQNKDNIQICIIIITFFKTKGNYLAKTFWLQKSQSAPISSCHSPTYLLTFYNYFGFFRFKLSAVYIVKFDSPLPHEFSFYNNNEPVYDTNEKCSFSAYFGPVKLDGRVVYCVFST